MRKIKQIILHCSATPKGVAFFAQDIKRWHLERGFNDIGYHFVLCLDGTIQKGRNLAKVGAHCKGYNKNSIGICYIGGIDAQGNACDTRTRAQKKAFIKLLSNLKADYPDAEILGHNELSNKDCPCFNVAEYRKKALAFVRSNSVFLRVLFLCLFFSSCRTWKNSQQNELSASVERTQVQISTIIKQKTDSVLFSYNHAPLQAIAPDRSYLSNDFAESTAFIDSAGLLFHSLAMKDTAVYVHYSYVDSVIIRDSVRIVEKLKERRQTIKKTKKSAFSSFALILFFLVLTAFILHALRRKVFNL